MQAKKNPLGLNRLQLKTLTLFQALARLPGAAEPDGEGGARIHSLPHAHGDHFHLGPHVVMGADATGLANQAVWVALARKGLIAEAAFPLHLHLTAAGAAYETGLAGEILRGGDH